MILPPQEEEEEEKKMEIQTELEKPWVATRAEKIPSVYVSNT